MSEATERGGHDSPVMPTAVLKALAHPLRRRIIRVFQRGGTARAADVAAELGIPANKVSFHLRVLADAGLLVEAPEHARDRRDRVWTAAEVGGWNLGGPEHPIEDEVAGRALMGLIFEEHLELVDRVARWAPEYSAGRAAHVHATFRQQTLHLTEAEFDDLMRRIDLLVKEVVAGHDAEDPETRLWQVDIVAADDRI